MPAVNSTLLSDGVAGVVSLYLMAKYKSRRGAILAAALLFFIYKKLGASAKLNPSTLPHYPFFGSGFGVMNKIRNRLHNEMLAIARENNFKGFSIHLPLSTNMALVGDEQDRKYVLKDNWKKFPKNIDGNGDWADGFRELFGMGIFAVDGEKWTNHRKAASFMFSNNSLRDQMEIVFQNHTDKLCKFFESKADTDEVFELQTLMASFTFDTICDIAFGHDPQALEDAMAGSKNEFLIAFDGLQAICTQRFFDPPSIMHIKRFFRVGIESQVKPYEKYMKTYIRKIVRERSQEISNPNDSSHARNDLLSMYIRYARSYRQDHMLEEEYLVDVVMNFMIAGRDTTSAVMTHMFKLLSADRALESRLREELDTLCDGGEPSLDKMHGASFADACFNETLRLYPSVANNFRMAAEDMTLPSGLKVTRGMKVAIPTYACGRNPENFKDPDSFVPERWMEWDEGKHLRRIPQYLLPAFWAGPRICLGKDMARFEAKVVMAKVLSKFTMDVLPHEEEFQNGPIIFYEHNLPCKVRSVV